MFEKVKLKAVTILHFTFIGFLSFFLLSCSISKQISRKANNILLKDTAIRSGQIGISIYEPDAGKYWYGHNADKYFVPASNTKLFTLYAGMKFLGDSIIGLKYFEPDDTTTIIQPTGDPTFLHPAFKSQNVFSYLKRKNKIFRLSTIDFEYLGKGWAWDDFKEYYMAQRSDFPIYGNTISIKRINKDSINVMPDVFQKNIKKTEPLITGFEIIKSWDNNERILLYNGNRQSIEIPFRPDMLTINYLLEDTLQKKIDTGFSGNQFKVFNIIHSQKSDSLFKIMMYTSDNFFAEQTLLMASNAHLGYMNDKMMISYLLDTTLAGSPQRPVWVDGSGLSRYNMFTPQSLVYILIKLKTEFGFTRIKNILPTGGTGTLKTLYIADSSFIYAKTGTLTSHVALSGYLITKKNKLLLFSIIANHFPTAATPVRKAIEKFLKGIREKY